MLAGGALGLLAGSAAIGFAGRAAIKRARRTRVLGITLPRELELRSVDLRKWASGADLRKVAKQIGNVSEQIEARSEDVRLLSGQAKRLSRKLS